MVGASQQRATGRDLQKKHPRETNHPLGFPHTVETKRGEEKQKQPKKTQLKKKNTPLGVPAISADRTLRRRTRVWRTRQRLHWMHDGDPHLQSPSPGNTSWRVGCDREAPLVGVGWVGGVGGKNKIK